MGAGVTISRYFGAGDYGHVSKAIHTDVMLGLLSGIVLTVVGVLLTPTFLRWMGTAPEVLPDAIAYFQYYFFGVLAVVMYNMCTSIMNALGDSKRPLYYLIISSLTNIVLDLLFIGGFGWGVGRGRRHDDLAGREHGAVPHPSDEKGHDLSAEAEGAAHRRRNARPDRPLRPALRRAELCHRLCQRHRAVQHQLRFGKVAMAAYGAYSKLEGFAFLPVTSFTMALTTFVGQNLGAGLHDRAKAGFALSASSPPSSSRS